MTTHVTQAEFARLLGVQRSYVTKLKGEGRLVLSEDGAVDVEASRARIAATADPRRDDVAQRWAAQRTRSSAPAAQESAESRPASAVSGAGATPDFQSARAMRERFEALTAKLEYERAAALVIDKGEVARAVEDVVTTTRQALENLPHRVAPDLVGKDLTAIRALLRQEITRVLDELARNFAERTGQLGAEGAA